MNRAYSLLEVKAVDEERRVIRGTATTPTPDRMGDIIEPLGVKFKNPVPLLWQHNSGGVVGRARLGKPTADGIEFEAYIEKIDEAESATLKARTDEAWASVKRGLVRGVSIGFRELEMAFMKEGGIHFLESEILELSLVTIPANSEATIHTIKSIDTVERAASGRDLDGGRPNPPGVTGQRKPVKMATEAKMAKKPIAEQISGWVTTRTQKADARDQIMDAAGERGETLDADEMVKYKELDDAVQKLDEHIGLLRDREKQEKEAAVTVSGVVDFAAASAVRSGRPTISVRQNGIKGLGFVQLLAARFMAKEDGVSPAEIAISKGWSDEVISVLRVPKNIIQKAAIAPATTTDSAWAGPLVVYQNLQNEIIELMRPLSVIPRIPGIRRVPFNVKVPREVTALTAYWVGQGAAKPVSKGALDTVTLDFAKVAGITYQTQELLRFSQPNSEQLMINSLTKAITYLVDRDFLDPAKAVATGVSPASITNGATAVTATGTNADAFRADFRSALVAYTMANYQLDGLVIVMTQTQALSLGLLRNDFGAKEFPDVNKDGGFIEGIPVVTSENIVGQGGSPADGAIIVFLNAPDILLADDGAVDVDISTEASIQADSAPDSPATGSTILISLWQHNLVAIRCERYVTWARARSDSVIYINGSNYR